MSKQKVELQEVLDELGVPTGELLPKEEIFKRGLWRLVVHVWLIDSRDELLVQRRADKQGKGIFDKLWDVTIGGGVEAEETSVHAAARELKEELGIIASEAELEYVDRYKLPKIIPESGLHMNDFSDTYILRRDIRLSDIKKDPSEVSLVRKMRLPELVSQVSHPEYSKLWVPHGAVYYTDVAERYQSGAI